MLQKATQKLERALVPGLLVIVLLAAASGGLTTFAPPEPALALSGETTSPERASHKDEELEIGLGQRVKFEHISVEHGLSQSSVNCILQDSKGFIWFGTNNGLNKYDGYNFTVYKSDPEYVHSLSHSTITSIVKDQRGALWIGTQDGLNRFDRETEQFTHYQADPENPHGLINSEIVSLYEDRSGVLWIGTRDGLDRFDWETEQFVHYQADPDAPYSLRDNEVLAIYEDRARVLWIGTWSGLARWNRETERFTHYQFAPEETTHLGHNAVQSIVEDEAGRLWIGTGGSGFYRFDRETEQFSQYLINPSDVEGFAYNDVKSVKDQAGVLWIGTDGGGLYQFNREGEQLIPHQTDPHDADSLSSNYITSIYKDQTGVLWIGTWGGGVNKFDRDKEKFIHYQTDPYDPNSLSHNRVLALYEDREGTLWIGTDGGGLDRFDRESDRFTHYRHDPNDPYSLSNNYVTSIYQDQAGDLWIGTLGGGLERFDRENECFIHYQADPSDPNSLSSDIVVSVYPDQEGVLWIGTDDGLNRFDRKYMQFTHYPSLGKAVRAIYQDREGVLWFGTESGLGKFDRAEGYIIRYRADPKDPNSLSHNAVYSVHQDQAGVLWIGTRGGLDKFDSATETFTHYREKDGLPSDVVVGIMEDDRGHLWLSTTGGLSRFDPQTETFKNYDASDGLQGYEFTGAHCKSKSGEMFFGGINGFNVLHPDRMTDNSHIPPVVLTSLTQNGEDVDVGEAIESVKEVTFRWPNNFFEFEFAALNFSQPEKNQYAYMLEGFDEDWNYVGTKRFGRYTNLPGRTYTLRIKGSNNDGVWNEEGISIQVTIIPPLWETWWFRGLVALVLAGGVTGGYRLRVRNIEARSRKLETQVKQRTHEIERRRQELEALYRADEKMYRHLHLNQVLQALVDVAVDILQADKGSVLMWDKEQERWLTRIARGFSPEAMALLSFARGEGTVGRVVTLGEPIIVEDVLTDPRREDERPEVRQAILSEGIRSFMHLPVVIAGEVFGVFNVNFDEPRAFGEEEQRLFLALAQRAALAIENARLFKAEQRRAEQFRVISEVGRRITSILAVDELLDQMARLIKEAFNYYHVGFGLVEGDEVVSKAEVGACRDAYQSQRLKLGQEGVWGWVAQNGEPLLVPDVSQEPRYQFMPQAAEIRSQMCVPLERKGAVIGVLSVESDQLNAFDESDLVVLQSLAHQTAIAIENAHLYEQAQQVAVVEERNRLARDLHDAVTQTLFSASLIAETLPTLWESDQDEGRQLLKELRRLSRGALAEMRTLLLELRPTVLVEANMGDLLRQLGETVTGRTGIHVTVTVEGECELPSDVHVALYRIAQETLNNVVKHAHASQVMVSLCCLPPHLPTMKGGREEEMVEVEVRVSDDGCGFDPSGVPPDCLGLGIIRERAQAVGATLTVESEVGRGTEIVVVWTGSAEVTAQAEGLRS